MRLLLRRTRRRPMSNRLALSSRQTNAVIPHGVCGSEESAFELWTKEELLNNQPQEFLLSDSQLVCGGKRRVKFGGWIFNDLVVYFQTALFNYAISLSNGVNLLEVRKHECPFLGTGNDLRNSDAKTGDCRDQSVRDPLESDLPNFHRRFAIAEHALEILRRFFPGVRAVKIGDDFPPEPHLRIHRMQLAGRNICL